MRARRNDPDPPLQRLGLFFGALALCVITIVGGFWSRINKK